MARDVSHRRLPGHVAAALCEIFGDGALEVRVVPNSLFARLHGRANATTRRNVIYLRGSLQAFLEDPELMLHEYFHVLHQWHTRRMTVLNYVLEWLKHGYWNNRFEREARDFYRGAPTPDASSFGGKFRFDKLKLRRQTSIPPMVQSSAT